MGNTRMIMAAAIALGATAVAKGEKPRMNVVMIAVDDLKPLLGCYGDGYAITPNIDRLAASGTLFRTAYCQQAVSAATRASLLTATRPDSTRVWDLKTLIRDMNPDILTMPQHFIAQGYTTAGIGKIYDPRSVDKEMDAVSWSVPYLPFQPFLDKEFVNKSYGGYFDPKTVADGWKEMAQAEKKGKKGYDRVIYAQQKVKPSTECCDTPDDAHSDGAIALGAIDYLRNYNDEKPFFLAVGFLKPHLPFVAPKQYWDLYKRDQVPLAAFRARAAFSPDIAYHRANELQSYTDIPSVYSFSDINNVVLPVAKQRELIHGYYACVSFVDAQIGRVLDELQRLGLDKNTVVVLWGDHGWHLGDHGLWCKHSDFEQAVHVPLIFRCPGIRPGEVASPVEFTDVFPTLCQMAGVAVPDGLDGVSLAPLAAGKEKAVRRYAVSQWPQGPKMGYSLRTERYRYTIWIDWKNRVANPGDVTAEELYDYRKDPNETVNVIGKKEYAAAAAEMRGMWAQYAAKNIRK